MDPDDRAPEQLATAMGARARARNSSPPTRPDATEIQAVPLRHPGRWLSSFIVLVLVAMLIHALVTNPRFQWGVIGQYFTTGQVISGLELTLLLTLLAMAIGIALGVLLAVMRMSPNPVLSSVSWFYIWFFRGTPVLVQLIFWYNISALFPHIGLGVPFGPVLVGVNVNSIVTPMVAAILGLGLNEGAYMSEIIRAGMLSVGEGQLQAASSLGMTRGLTIRRIVLPQAMRVIIPPTGNETIGMLKTTSLVSVISVTELLYTVELVFSRNFETIPLLIVASLWYLIVTTILTTGQYYIERHYARGAARALPPTPLQRLATWYRDMLGGGRPARPAGLADSARSR
jgi:polar amino acid transport system permease protein